MKEFVQILIGNATLPQFLAALTFAYITSFAMLMYRTTKRDVNSERTPNQFSWSFLIRDNSARISANIILIFLSVRFSQAWIGAEWTTYAAVAIGLISDKLGWLLEKLSDKLSENAQKKMDKL